MNLLELHYQCAKLGKSVHQSRVKYQDGGVRMKGIPHGHYTKEFREEAVKMVLAGGMNISPKLLLFSLSSFHNHRPGPLS